MPYSRKGELEDIPIGGAAFAPGIGQSKVTDLGTPWPKKKLSKRDWLILTFWVIVLVIFAATYLMNIQH